MAEYPTKFVDDGCASETYTRPGHTEFCGHGAYAHLGKTGECAINICPCSKYTAPTTAKTT